ncbi:hypothetical protein HPP92_021829 [Vanilla planifolia]|uniref:Multidrug and toxic compound extrusion protein n=1 Tax=Vanilla planifolia TaxID=51239 RepID=A0A835PTG5_VANPL|nr:hypothetical protein HPP92_022150 [Vanilla planifolia]KAG0458701.1 hypothetical protein HPP92_021829 [Vanilla planifolia]
MSVPLLHKAKSNDETPILNPRPTIHQLALSIIEARSILNLAFPMVLTGLLLYTRSMISMFFLGRLDPAIAEAAQSFILFSIPDLLLQSFLHPLRIYFRTQSIVLPLSATAAATAALHFPINYFLVSYLRLGIPGVALASVFTNLNLVLLLVLYLYFSVVVVRDHGSTMRPPPPSTIHGRLHGHPHSNNFLDLYFPSSISASVSTRVGNELGANQPERARRAALVGLACGTLLGIIAFSFSFSVRNVWAKIFTVDAEIVSLTAAVLPILGLCELGNCPQTTGCGVLRGSARPRAGANINLGSFYGVGMPVALGLAFWAELHFRGLWLGLLAAQTSCVVLMLTVIARTDWKRQADRAQNLTGGPRANDEEFCKPISIKIEQCEL